MKLTAENVHKVFMKCLFEEGEPNDNHIVAEGVLTKVGFHPGRLEENKTNIQEMLECLPPAFQKNQGGGWSFLNMCQDKDDVQWASMHQTMDELVCLGLASEKVSFLLPRELWSALPGAMPYLVVKS